MSNSEPHDLYFGIIMVSNLDSRSTMDVNRIRDSFKYPTLPGLPIDISATIVFYHCKLVTAENRTKLFLHKIVENNCVKYFLTFFTA